MKMSTISMLLMVTVGLNILHYSRSIDCEDIVHRVGSSNHVRIINPVCYPEGILHYRWKRNDPNVNSIQVDYNCSFSNSTENVESSDPLWTVPRDDSNTDIRVIFSRGNASLHSCIVGGCYFHQTTDEYLEIPSVTCSRYSTISTPGVSIAPTTSFMFTSIQSSSTPTLDLQPSVTSLTTIPVSSPLLSQPTSTPTENLTSNGLADRDLIIIVLLSIGTLLIIFTVLIASCGLFAKKLRSRRRNFDFKKHGPLSNAELVDACLPPPKVEEDTKTDIVCLGSVTGEILLDFKAIPLQQTHLVPDTEPDNSSCSASESDSFTLSQSSIQPDVEAKTDSESDHEENITNESSLDNDGTEDVDPNTASDASIKFDIAHETENEHKSSANVDSSNEHHITQACTELDCKTDESLNMGASHEHQNITLSFHNVLFEPDILAASSSLPIGQDHTGSSAGYVVMGDDTLLYHSQENNSIAV